MKEKQEEMLNDASGLRDDYQGNKQKNWTLCGKENLKSKLTGAGYAIKKKQEKMEELSSTLKSLGLGSA